MDYLLTDNELLIAFYNGDGDAFEKIYKAYWKLLFNEARKILKDNEMAKDAVQDAFVKLLHISKQANRISSLDGFLLTTLRHRAFNSLDHEKVRETFIKYIQTYDINEVSEIEEEVFDRPEYVELQRQKRVDQEISNLPPKMRKAFVLAKKERMSYKEIAQQTGSSEGTIKKQIHNALSILRSKLLFFL